MRSLIAALLVFATFGAADASCLVGTAPTYEDISYVSVSRFTIIEPQDPQFAFEVHRSRWSPGDPDADAFGTVYHGWLNQKSKDHLAPGSYALKSVDSKSLFDRLVGALKAASFYTTYLTPYQGHFVDGPYDAVSAGRCGVKTTLTAAPLGDSAQEVANLDDASGKRFLDFLATLQTLIYAAPWYLEGPLRE